jgi:CPA2 family monovalent cation:H+ antiporter-2
MSTMGAHDKLFIEVLIMLAAGLVGIVLFRRLRLPPIVAYLAVGVILGPQTFNAVQSGPVLNLLGEIGVALLLFTIGLEFSLGQLRAMRSMLLKLGGGQVLLGTAAGAVIAWYSGIAWEGAVIVGGALALSSTAIVVKQLTDQLELKTDHGRISVGVLLFQDLAAVPFIVVIPILAQSDGELAGPLLLALLKGIAALVILLAAGRWLLRPLFHEVASARSAELFTITVVLVSLAAAWGTAMLGLSLALGAFLAGMMLGETEYRHQIENDIRPIRDLLVGLFFIAVGMRLNFVQVAADWLIVLILVAGLIVGKGGVVFLLGRAAGAARDTALRAGLILGQGGEFSIAVLTLAMLTGLLSLRQGQPILAAVVITMLLAPLLIRRSDVIIRGIGGSRAPTADLSQYGQQKTPEDVVLLCGYGRTGQLIAGVLDEIGAPYAALDRDPQGVKAAWEAGAPVYFGDAGNTSLLEAAGLKRARAVVLSFSDLEAERRVIEATRRDRPGVPILVRAKDDADLDALIAAGASEGVPETLEAALMLVFQLLVLLEVPAGKALEHIRIIRSGRYPLLKGFLEGVAPAGELPTTRHYEVLKTLVLPAGARAIGRRLADLGFSEKGILIASVRRPGTGLLSPLPDLCLEAGDVLVLHGSATDLTNIEREML